jgi:hypothetical protein
MLRPAAKGGGPERIMPFSVRHGASIRHPSNTGLVVKNRKIRGIDTLFREKGATGATLLIIRYLRCYIWCYISATMVLHFITFASIWLNLTIFFTF